VGLVVLRPFRACVGGAFYTQGCGLGWYVMPFQGEKGNATPINSFLRWASMYALSGLRRKAVSINRFFVVFDHTHNPHPKICFPKVPIECKFMPKWYIAL